MVKTVAGNLTLATDIQFYFQLSNFKFACYSHLQSRNVYSLAYVQCLLRVDESIWLCLLFLCCA